MKIVKLVICGNNEKLELVYEDDIYTLIKDNNKTRKKLYSFNFDGGTVFEIDSDNYNRIAVFGNKKVCVFEKGNKIAEFAVKKKICSIKFDITGKILILYTAKAERFYIDLSENKFYNDDEFYAYEIYNEAASSENGKFFMGVNSVIGVSKEVSFFSVYNTEENKKICEFKAPFGIGGKRMAVSNSGKYALSAAYSRYGASLVDLHNGEIIWNNKDIKRIQYVNFGKNEETAIVSNEDERIYFIDIKTGEVVDKIKGRKYYVNNFGDDVISNGKKAKFGKINIESPTFAFLDILPLKNGIAFAPVSETVFMCDYNGEIMWRCNVEHVFKMKYADNIIYCICKNDFFALNAENGNVIYSDKIYSGWGSVFIEDGIADTLGNIYKFNEKGIHLTNEKMSFLGVLNNYVYSTTSDK